MSDNIKMGPLSEQESSKKEKEEEVAKKIGFLADDNEVTIWEDGDPNDRYVFVKIGNGTLGMTEAIFYTLTKATQMATKKLLQLGD